MKTVLITGGNKGIGFATAKEFLENNYNVIIAGRNEEKLKSATEKLGGKVKYIVWDVTNFSLDSYIINMAHELFGDIDTFINNAGIVTDEDISGTHFFNMTEKSWDDTMDTNLKGLFFALQAEAKYMSENKISGHIVNVCSEMSFRVAYNPYGISKWGALGLTKGLAKRLISENIILNGIAPGETATEILRQEEGMQFKNNSLRGERAMPYEVAKEIYFLATSKNIIGGVLLSDGGRSLY